jgi:formate hydrogenlyase subunit 3/multisubunit Na+/H+ antiporter MnhD subunit
MTEGLLILLVIVPLLAIVPVFWLPKRTRGICTLLASIINFIIAIALFNREYAHTFPWAGFGMNLSLRLYHFSGFMILAASFFGLLIALYSLDFLKEKEYSRQFYTYLLISLSFVNGAFLADNLVVLLFFWEGLLLTLYGMIAIGGRKAFRTATKALIIVGVSDLCMMAGIALTGYLSRTLVIRDIGVPPSSLGSLAFVLLVIGAISKAGSMPFHTWIPDAAVDAPLPFMAFFPASIEKLLGIYFLARITLDMFQLETGSVMSIILMAVGAVTIVLAVMMALIQRDYKRLLSYHAISQVGYMVLGIGTCLPIGIIGGIFHMLNNALYKCGLFLTGGVVEKGTGTTDLGKLGGLRSNMPITFFSFLIVAASISGVPPFNGFFSKELVYDAALERGMVFYLAAVIGSFFTAASFLKLGHASFMGERRPEHKDVKEAPLSMLIPIVTLALACILFGLFSRTAITKVFEPIVAGRAESAGSMGLSWVLVAVSVLVLAGAFIHHFVMARMKGSGLKAVDDIHHAPVLSVLYGWAEKRYFDPYEIGVRIVGWMSHLLWRIDRGIDWIYETLIVRVANWCSRGIRRMQAGYYVIYVVWSLVGALLIMLFGRLK